MVDMRFLDKLFNKNEKQNNAKNNNKILNEYEIPSKDGINTIVLFRITSQGSIKHRNQEITNLITARIMKNRDGDTMYVDSSDYISFELPAGQALTQDILKAVMQQYDMQNNGQKSYYIGRLAYSEGKINFENKSNAVQNMVNEIVESSENRRQEELKASIEAKKQRENNFRKEISVNTYKYENETKRIREQRISNPSIKNIGTYKINGKTYMDYDGIDTCGGEILRLRRVDKVGKDGNGTYLYSAYISKTPNEDDVEFLNGKDPNGYPVCFTLGKRLEDIVNEKNHNEINAILNLLSNPYNFTQKDKLAYIGDINKYGQMKTPTLEDRFENKDTLTAIGLKIKAMQEEYSRRVKANQKQWEER